MEQLAFHITSESIERMDFAQFSRVPCSDVFSHKSLEPSCVGDTRPARATATYLLKRSLSTPHHVICRELAKVFAATRSSDKRDSEKYLNILLRIVNGDCRACPSSE